VNALAAALDPIFQENFATRGELGAAVSVWIDGREEASLAGGQRHRPGEHPWTPETLALIYSGTKGPSAACVIKCLWDAGILLDEPVASVWPEFAGSGKAAITFADVLAHRSGISAVDDPPDVFNYAGVIRAIERQAPLWPVGEGHGYCPRISGYLWDEIVRRVAHISLGKYWREQIAGPAKIDFWIGLPENRISDVATLYPAKGAPPDDQFVAAYSDQTSITHRAFGSPRGLFSISSMNTAAARITPFPAFGGVGSASALAKFYCMMASGGEIDGARIMPAEAAAAMTRPLTNGFDRVLQMDTAFSTGVMMDPLDAGGKKLRATFGPSLGAFGQPGAGGSLGFGDPDRRIGFAYVMNQMEHGVLPNEKSKRLIQRMYEALGESSPA
jgi:CubicO group peptidase (beta-lactamase class C family)